MIEKIKNKIKKIYKKTEEVDLKSRRIANAFYVFLLSISVLYGGMIWGLSEKIKREADDLKPARYPSALERNIRKLVAGHPIEKMAPFIAERNQPVASYMVAIAKKESNWGKLSPKKNGRECWNFWGYRGKENPTASGYSCFKSPEEAVSVVGKRMKNLIEKEKMNTPRKMAVAWKCGYDCSWDNPGAVSKWASDVGYYLDKMEE